LSGTEAQIEARPQSFVCRSSPDSIVTEVTNFVLSHLFVVTEVSGLNHLFVAFVCFPGSNVKFCWLLDKPEDISEHNLCARALGAAQRMPLVFFYWWASLAALS